MKFTTWGIWNGPRLTALNSICQIKELAISEKEVNEILLTDAITMIVNISFQFQTLTAKVQSTLEQRMHATYKIGLETLYTSLPFLTQQSNEKMKPIVEQLIADALKISAQNSNYLVQLAKISQEAKRDAIPKLYGDDFSDKFDDLAKQLPFNDPELLDVAISAVRAKIPTICAADEEVHLLLNEHVIYMKEVADQLPANPDFAGLFIEKTGLTMKEYKKKVALQKSKQAQSNTFFENPEEHAKKFINWLDSIGKRGFNASLDDINTQFSSSFDYRVNGTLVATDASSLQQRFAQGSEEYTSAYIHQPLIEFALDGFKLNATYDATFTRKNGDEQKTTNTMTAEFDRAWKVEKFTQSFNPPLAKVQVIKSDIDTKTAYNQTRS